MSHLITCHDWSDNDDYTMAWAPTNDPRVVAIIKNDDEASFERNLDGDAILPTYLIDGDRASHTGGYEDDEDLANRIVEARDRFRYAAGYRYDGLSYAHIAKSEAMLARWAWIFHGTTFYRGSYGYQNAYDVLVMNTPAYREHVGADELTREEAQSWVDATTSEIANIADGYVYGVGYAVHASRVMDDEPIDINDGDWNEEIQCWGFVGEEYAQQNAASFEHGTPELPELLDLITTSREA